MTRPIEKLPDDIVRAGMSAIRVTIHNIREKMSVEGQPVKRPVPWDTPRQKRYVLWKLKGQPYQRTHKYRLGWKSTAVPNGISLRNAHPAGAIGGTVSGWQSRVTRGRWTHLLKVLFEELAKFPSNLSNQLEVMGKQPE